MYNIGWVMEIQKISPTSEVHAGLTLARSLALEPAPCCAPERLSASCRRSSSSPSASSSSSPKSYRRSTPSARSLALPGQVLRCSAILLHYGLLSSLPLKGRNERRYRRSAPNGGKMGEERRRRRGKMRLHPPEAEADAAPPPDLTNLPSFDK